MRVTATAFPEVLLLDPQSFTDVRGFFFESFNQKRFEEATGQVSAFVQDNQSLSLRGVVRGLHYQIPPKAQGKLVRVVRGEIFDVVVDLRRGSPRFGKWVSAVLSADNKRQIWIPAGFAHGFQALSEAAEVIYKTTDYWSVAHERSLRWDDPALGIDWPLGAEPLLSDKDRGAPALAQAEYF